MNSWFESRPLFGQRVLVTRATNQAEQFAAKLSDLGAEVVLQPAIEIVAPSDFTLVDQAIKQLEQTDWVVFSSGNGVRYFLERVFELGLDVRAFSQTQLAAIGPGTAAMLENYHLKADLIPDEYRAESMVAALTPHVENRQVLLIRANRGRDVLPNGLRDAGAEVEETVVYHSQDVDELSGVTEEALEEGIDWITFTSSAIARSSIKLLGDHVQSMKSASISPITSETMRELGVMPTVEASSHDLDGLLQAILEYRDA